MSRRTDVVLLLACAGTWALAAARLRTAFAVDVTVAPLAAATLAPRLPVLYDVAKLGRQGAFRPLTIRPLPAIDTTIAAKRPAPEPPPVQLKGIIGGPPWLAVLGVNGGGGDDRVLRVGDSLGAVELREVRKDQVTLFYRDSTWTIALRQERQP